MIKRIKIKIRFSFMFIVTFAMLLDESGVTFYSLIAAVIHEAGHIIALLSLERCTINITLSLRGISARQNGMLKREVLCLAAGPTANFFVAFICLPSPIFSAVNLIVGVVNLLPIGDCDGGRLLHIFLCRYITATHTDSIERMVGVLFLVPLFAALFFVTMANPYNYTLLIFVIYMIIFLIEGRGLD